MNDLSESRETNPASVEPRTATDAVREPIPRTIYVTMRMKELTTQVAEMTKEREKLRGELKSPEGAGGGDRKALRYRVGYLTQRITVSKQERSDLSAEKTTQRSARVARRTKK